MELFEKLLVNLLSHHVRPINHASSKIEVNGARASRFIDDGYDAVMVIQGNLADVSFVSEQQ